MEYMESRMQDLYDGWDEQLKQDLEVAEAVLAAYERALEEYLDAHPVNPIAHRGARIDAMRKALNVHEEAMAKIGSMTDAARGGEHG